MSLLTYDDARPWARSIKNRVSKREMPPWNLDPTVGIKEILDDPSLSDQEIQTIAKWVDSGAAKGDGADMPPLGTVTTGVPLRRAASAFAMNPCSAMRSRMRLRRRRLSPGLAAGS